MFMGGGGGGGANVLGQIYGGRCSTWGTNNQIMPRMWGVSQMHFPNHGGIFY